MNAEQMTIKRRMKEAKLERMCTHLSTKSKQTHKHTTAAVATAAVASTVAAELMMEKAKWKLVQTVVVILSRSLLCVNYLASSMGFFLAELFTFRVCFDAIVIS